MVRSAGVERDGVVIHLQAVDHTKRQPGHGAVNVFVTDVDALYCAKARPSASAGHV